MRINHENKSMDMESRDLNYILPAYVRSYLFHNKNEMPEKIIFPMFASVAVGATSIPIEYVPPLSEIAVEIAKDGGSVAEVTPSQEAALDEKDEEIKKLKEEVAKLTQTEVGGTQKEETTKVSPARAAFTEAAKEALEEAMPYAKLPDRKPNQPPGGDIGPGLGLSDMHSRDRRDQARTAKDLKEEPNIDESAEKDYEKEVSRGEDGKPVVEGDSSAASG